MILEPIEEGLHRVARRGLVAAIREERHLDLLDLIRDIHPEGMGDDDGVGKSQLPERLGLGNRLLAGDQMHWSMNIRRPTNRVVRIPQKGLPHQLASSGGAHGTWHAVAEKPEGLGTNLDEGQIPG